MRKCILTAMANAPPPPPLPPSKRSRKSLIAAIVIAIVVVAAVVGAYLLMSGSNAPSNTPSPTPPPTETPTETPKPPDLEVREIFIVPSQPQAGEYFSAQVEIANIGETKSGSYDLALKIKDVSRGWTYPIGTFQQVPMYPNEYYWVWQSDHLRVDSGGAFQLWAEIIPIGFEDGDDYNNMLGWAFTVTP